MNNNFKTTLKEHFHFSNWIPLGFLASSISSVLSMIFIFLTNSVLFTAIISPILMSTAASSMWMFLSMDSPTSDIVKRITGLGDES